MLKEKIEIPLLMYDPIFKSIFMKLPNILSKFIYDITGNKYNNIILGMNELPINRYKEKFKRCDFIINTDSNTIINIELNNDYSKTMLVKNTSYIFNIFSRYTSSGNKYNKDIDVIQININNFSRFDKPILDYQILNNSYSYVYFRGLKILDLDIVNCRSVYYNQSRKRKVIKWGALFSCITFEEMEPILNELLNKKEVYIFMEELKKITRFYNVVDEKEALRLDDMFRRSLKEEFLELGRTEGIEQTTINIIKSMINNKLDYKLISKVSGKSIKEIKEVEKTINK